MSSIDYETLLKTRTTYKHVDLDVEVILKNIEKGEYIIPNEDVTYISSKEEIIKTIVCLIRRIPIIPINMYYDDKTRKYVILEQKCQSKILDIFMYFNGLYYKDEIKKEINFQDVIRIIKEINLTKDLQENSLSLEEIIKKELTINKLYKELENKYNLVESEFLINNSKDFNITLSILDEKAKSILRRKELLFVLVQCESEDTKKIYSDIIKMLN